MYFVKTPFFASWLYPDLVWSIPNAENKIFLTFDDGVNETLTNFILECLAVYQFKATFFLVGENCQRFPQQVDKILAAGHTIGNHTFEHLNGWNTPDDLYFKNITKAQTYCQSHLFRPPYGKIKLSQINQLKKDYKIIMWSLMAGDFDNSVDARTCLARLKKHTAAGSIIVLHDNLKFQPIIENVLAEYLYFCAKQGFNLSVIN